ncbi:hypothetical protein BDY17DRAFT_288105 [Neohortaea acidophila]|uniref:FAD/NAD(P)-binding domain-containing protein n=1 Tax=Neohortaea acidophila TaxID=245834 RepID=A0A6A6Q3W4_9PEZI|nr:uncharacterized protein BDY17DRAFT_288105 [Neohortaea acidophila]KAF2486985.1 hypothetical protein BDY17DRAFT_288105 [Neohortaea acidophila]
MGSVGEKKVDVLVVGAGFGGCYLLHILRKHGLSVQLLEAGTTVGGVWAWNRYPGARVDCEMPYYGFSDPDVWSTFTWTERYPCDTELRKYFQHVVKVWDLEKDIHLRTRVVEANYSNGGWRVKTDAGDHWSCKWLIAATGTSAKPHIPHWKGMEKFKGVIHHSSLWPEQPVDMAGKRVAVIGCGSTGVQVMQEAPKVAKAVTQFIKTPNLAVPMRQRQISEEEIYSNKCLYPHIFRACRGTRTGLPIENLGRKVFDDDDTTRRAIWDERWKRGGFNWSQGGYTDHIIDEKSNRAMYDYWVEQTRKRMKDGPKRELLAPLEPPYFISTKRPSLEQDYYEMCDLDHVTITNSPIVEFTETGIKTEDGKVHEFDIVAICTGYDAVTGGLRQMGLKGRGGVDLDEKWKDGVATNVGMIAHGYPNMFMVYGPQAPTSLTNGPPFLELQGDWILSVIEQQIKDGLATVEANKEAEEAWREHCLDLASKTLLIKTNSWYMGANVPGKKREFLVYLGGIPMWHKACVDALDGWKGFEVHQTAT